MKSLRHKIKFLFTHRLWSKPELAKKIELPKQFEENPKPNYAGYEVGSIIDEMIETLKEEKTDKKLTSIRGIEIEAQIGVLKWLKKEIYGNR